MKTYTSTVGKKILKTYTSTVDPLPRILLIYPGWTKNYYSWMNPARLFSRQYSVFPPLNLAYLATIAEDLGYVVKIYDGELNNASMSDYHKVIRKFQPDIVGFTSYTPSFHIAEEIARDIKIQFPWITTLIGGSHFSAMNSHSDFLPDSFDVGFVGKSLLSWEYFLLGHHLGTKLRRGVDRDSTIIYVRPARHLLENKRYKRPTKNGVKKFTTIFTSVGCPFKCIFCWNEHQNIIYRDIEDVLDEMEEIKVNDGISHFVMLDDTLTINKERTIALCQGIIKRNLNITFEGSTRANLVDEELMELMYHAGLVGIGFGLETADESLRKQIGKNIDTSAYIKANRLANQYDVITQNSCIVGLPGDTLDSIKKTLIFLREHKDIKQANISIATPYPGTELYRMAKNNEGGLRLLTEDFSQYKRYGSAVMDVGELSAKELVKIQQEAFGSIYIVPWRWKYTIKRSGFFGLVSDLLKIAKLILLGKWRFLFHISP